ncbi:hypothetical protein L195_g049815 [Trifolium pratense]|uniref:Uncharacterized protein n=1 Tax=Trifolium pratense TaxID=57577 RepID=A0A2K3JQJ3_TRIPR|nr:hypothetical protein L195_g049815 [Trifolium pratense]
MSWTPHLGGVGNLSKCSEMLSELKTRRGAVVKLSSSGREHPIASWGSTGRVLRRWGSVV